MHYVSSDFCVFRPIDSRKFDSLRKGMLQGKFSDFPGSGRKNQRCGLVAATRNDLTLDTEIFTYSGVKKPHRGDGSIDSSDSEFDFDDEDDPSVQDTDLPG